MIAYDLALKRQQPMCYGIMYTCLPRETEALGSIPAMGKIIYRLYELITMILFMTEIAFLECSFREFVQKYKKTSARKSKLHTYFVDWCAFNVERGCASRI
jgi:hypothetical protein